MKKGKTKKMIGLYVLEGILLLGITILYQSTNQSMLCLGLVAIAFLSIELLRKRIK